MQKLITMCGLLLCTVAALPAQEREDGDRNSQTQQPGNGAQSATTRSPATPWRLRRAH